MCLNVDCRQRYTEREFNSIRFRSLLTAALFLVLAITGVGVIAFAISNLDDFDLPVAIGISAAAAIAVIGNVFMALWFWRYRIKKPGLLIILAAVIFIGLTAYFTAAAYTGIAPFSDGGSPAAEDNGNGTAPDQSPTPSPPPARPTPTMSGDVGITRQDRSLRVTLDGICSGQGNNVKIEMTIVNVGESDLTVTGIQTIPEADLINNPLTWPDHTCYQNIKPGQKCYNRTSNNTHIEYEPDNLDRETYLVVRGEDLNGNNFGVTFKLQPANGIPECP